MLNRRAQSGLSIIEIFITLAIVGIVLAFAGPYALVWIQNVQLRNAAEAVLSGVNQARVEALKRNTNVLFQLTEADSTAWTVCLYDVANDTCSAAPDAIIAQKSAAEASGNARLGTDVAQGDPAIPIPAGANMPAQVAFDSLGRLSPASLNNIQRVDVRNPTLDVADERRLVIMIGVGGQVRMCDPKLQRALNPQGCV